MSSYAEVMMKESNEKNGRVIGVKVSYGEEIRRASFKGSSLSNLRSVCADLFSFYDGELIGLKYKDGNGTLITMSSDSDVVEAIKLGDPLHLVVVDKESSVPSTPLVSPLSEVKQENDPVAITECGEQLQELRIRKGRGKRTQEERAAAQEERAAAREERIAAKQQKKEHREAVTRERQEIRDALAAAKKDGDEPAINECKAKLQQFGGRRKARTLPPSTDTSSAPTPAPRSARGRGRACTTARGEMLAVNNKKKELRGNFAREKQALQEAIAAAKEKGDKQAIKETRTTIRVLRETFHENVAALSPAKPSAAFRRERKEVCYILLAAKKQGDKQTIHTCQEKLKMLKAKRAERKAECVAARQEGKELRQELAAAKTAGDKQAITAARAKIVTFRETHSKKPAEGMRIN